MNMRMNFEFLAPGMQHAEEANLCAEVSRIASHFEKGFGTGAEQEIVEDLLGLQNQWRQAAANPADSRPHAGDVGRDADSGPSLSDRYDLTGFEWCAGQHHPRVDGSQNSDEACEDEHLSGGPLAGRLPCKRSTPPWCRSAYHRYASGCLETARRLACAVIRASAHAAPRVVLG